MSDIVHAREQDRSAGLFPVGEAILFHEKLRSVGIEPERAFWLPATRAA